MSQHGFTPIQLATVSTKGDLKEHCQCFKLLFAAISQEEKDKYLAWIHDYNKIDKNGPIFKFL